MSSIKRRNYTFSLNVDDTPNLKLIIKVVEKMPKYAYILHDKDKDDYGHKKKDHYHFYIEFPNPRYLNSIAKDLEIDSNYIEKVYDKKGILNYLTHRNQPEKYQYDIKEVKTNFDIEEEGKDDLDVIEHYRDMRAVRLGLMTPEEYLEKYRMYLLRHCSFYNITRITSSLLDFDKYVKEFEGRKEHRGLSMFRVPCSIEKKYPEVFKTFGTNGQFFSNVNGENIFKDKT